MPTKHLAFSFIAVFVVFFSGKGFISANGGNVYDQGGGGAGGRITINYQQGVFHSDHTSACGGTANGKDAENGGPGVIYLFGQTPLNKNLRIDNKGKPAVVKSRLIYSSYHI